MANSKDRKKRKKVLRRLEGLAEVAPQYFGKQYQHATKELENAHNPQSVKAQQERDREEEKREQDLQERAFKILSRAFQGGAEL